MYPYNTSSDIVEAWTKLKILLLLYNEYIYITYKQLVANFQPN